VPESAARHAFPALHGNTIPSLDSVAMEQSLPSVMFDLIRRGLRRMTITTFAALLVSARRGVSGSSFGFGSVNPVGVPGPQTDRRRTNMGLWKNLSR
jgi:hypothetical protein